MISVGIDIGSITAKSAQENGAIGAAVLAGKIQG